MFFIYLCKISYAILTLVILFVFLFLMDQFDYKFDKIFVLKSLGEADTYAEALFYETIEPYCRKCGLATERPIEIYERSDWDKAIKKILQDEHKYPLIHFEMHGNEKDGLSLRLGDFVAWPDVINDLTKINIRSEFNLIITMAVCYSTKLASNISLVKQPAPYLFSVTTRIKVQSELTYKLFSVFFKELIETKEIYSALKQVEKTNPDWPPLFDILAVPFLFENIFRSYVKQHQNNNQIEKGFYHTFPDMQEKEMTRTEFENYKNSFITVFRTDVNKCYKKYRDTFFMFDIYPNNRLRFVLPNDII